MSAEIGAEDFNIIEYLAKTSASLSAYFAAKHPEQLWMIDLQRYCFEMIATAHANGKPIVLTGPNVPIEIIYAMDCVPMLLDTFPSRLASEGEMMHRYLDIADNSIYGTSCALNRGGLGVVLSGDLPQPDAFIYTTTPCDSGRGIYAAVKDTYNCPTFQFDTPFRQDDEGHAYIAKGIAEMVEFLETTFDRKLDLAKLQEVIVRSNYQYELQGKIADLRKVTPCPLPSRFLVLNEFFGATVGSEGLTPFLETEYKFASAQVAAGRGACKEEKYRIVFMQNMPWFAVNILDWMEKTYGAVVTMDAFGNLLNWPIEDMSSFESIYFGLAKRVLGQPMTHGSAGPVESNMEIIRMGVEDYHSDICFFAGHVGCKHTWAVSKLLSDMAYDKWGVRTFSVDADFVDYRYKSVDQVKADIAAFFDTLED